MELSKLRPIVGNNHWHLIEDYLEEKKRGYLTRLVAEDSDIASNILRGRIREIDLLLGLASKVLSK
jgi:hypothetical protein